MSFAPGGLRWPRRWIVSRRKTVSRRRPTVASRAVPLKGGGKGIEYRVSYLVTADDLGRILAYWQRDWTSEFSDEPLPELTRAQAEWQIRNLLRYAGWESFLFWSDGVSDQDVETIWAWAEKQVAK